MRVKICGLTNLEDAVLCETTGADAVGFVNYTGRKRSLMLDEISDICSSLGPIITKVLVCAPKDLDSGMDMFVRSDVDALQLYSLDPSDLEELQEHGIKVIRAVPPDREEASRFADCSDALLFEGGTPGSGTSYDYSSIPLDCCCRPIIAGGLNPDNLESAKSLNPYALDVSSGVESSPGKKDPYLVEEFVRRCRL